MVVAVEGSTSMRRELADGFFTVRVMSWAVSAKEPSSVRGSSSIEGNLVVPVSALTTMNPLGTVVDSPKISADLAASRPSSWSK